MADHAREKALSDLSTLRREVDQHLDQWPTAPVPHHLVRRLLEALTEMEQEAANWQDAYDQDHAAMIAGDERIVELDKERSRLDASLLALRGYVQQLEAERDQARVVTMGEGDTSRTAAEVLVGSGEPTTPNQQSN